MQLNSKLVEEIGNIFVSNIGNIVEGTHIPEHNLGSDITLKINYDLFCYQLVINGKLTDSYYSEDVNGGALHKDISRVLFLLSMEVRDEENMIREMVDGISIHHVYETPIGLTVKSHSDLDSRTVMIAQTGNPNSILYAFSEAINQDLSIDPELLSSTNEIVRKIIRIASDYILADLVTHDVKL